MLHAEGLDDLDRRAPQHLEPRAGARDVAARRRRASRTPPRGDGQDRHRRQVRAPEGLVQVAPRGARARRPRQRVPGRARVHRLRAGRAAGARGAPLEPRRRPRPRRLRRPRHRGEDRGDRLRADEPDPVLRHLPRACSSRSSSSRATSPASPGANSSEFDKDTPHAVIDLMPDQRGVRNKGATMRLGAYPCVLVAGIGRRRRVRARRRSASATATATSSRTTTATRCRRRGWSSAGRRRTSASSRWSSCASTRSSWAASSTRSSRAARRRRTRSSRASCARRSSDRRRAPVPKGASYPRVRAPSIEVWRRVRRPADFARTPRARLGS